MDIHEYKKKVIPKLRKRHIDTTKVMINETMIDYVFDEREDTYYLNNASEFIISMREIIWNKFRDAEKVFNAAATAILFDNPELIQQLTTLLHDESLTDEQKLINIVTDFTGNYEEHLFELNKSNTNSRRSRAGNEFEDLFKKILIKSNISFDDQGAVGAKRFKEVGISKLVDFVVPGVLEYDNEKPHTALVTMKTSLRERWQEVPEELSRTGAHYMFLFTLDRDISDEVITSLYEHRIYPVVLDDYKNNYYASNSRVYGLSRLLVELKRLSDYWISLTAQDLQSHPEYIQDKINLYEKRYKGTRLDFEKAYYKERINHYKSL